MDKKGHQPNQPTVSVIMPVYNGERFLQQSLDSVYAQHFTSYEIIVVDDGSTDRTPAILETSAAQHANLRIIRQENHGQGYARNRAMKKATGTYILFIDADDYIDSNLLEVTVARAEEDKADVVNFNWRLLNMKHDGIEELSEFNTEVFTGKSQLVGSDCEIFLQKHNYFAWDSLYRRSFLDEHHIGFGEGYIYEDNEFIVEVASYAQRISIVDDVLYTVRHGAGSSSRSQHDTPKHYHDLMRAMKRSFETVQARTPYTSFYLAAYFLEKFTIYYQHRVPRYLLNRYLHDFVDVLHTQKLVAPKGTSYRFLRSCMSQRIFEDKRYWMFFWGVQYKTKVLPLRDKLRSGRSKLHSISDIKQV